MNALADDKVSDCINDNFAATYLKVGTFEIIRGAKVGGNVASYFCMSDGTVLHAVPGKVDAPTLLREARWASELRKNVITIAADLVTGKVDNAKARNLIRSAHIERYQAAMAIPEIRGVKGGRAFTIRPPGHGVPIALPAAFPTHVNNQAKVHWLLAQQPLPKMETFYPSSGNAFSGRNSPDCPLRGSKQTVAPWSAARIAAFVFLLSLRNRKKRKAAILAALQKTNGPTSDRGRRRRRGARALCPEREMHCMSWQWCLNPARY